MPDSSKTGSLQERTPRASGALLALPFIDLAATAYVAPALRIDATGEALLRLLAALLASIFFWTGSYLLLRATLKLRARHSRSHLARLLPAALYSCCAGVLLYHLLWWSYVAANGQAPTPEALEFLRDNLRRIPEHILQTAPIIAVGTVAAALAGAFLLMRLVAASIRSRPAEKLLTETGGAVVLLFAWHVIGLAAAPNEPMASPMASAATTIDPARIQAALNDLPAREEPAAGTASARKRPVIVILVESLRHDLLTTNPEAIPFIRRMSEENVGFEYPYATASHSNLTDLAFWFAQYPLKGRGKEGFTGEAEWRGVSLFDLFQHHGYRTAYISSQNELWGGMINWLKTPSVDYYFDSESYQGATWENHDDVAGLGALIKRGIAHAGKVEDSETLAIARQWIEGLGGAQAFFLGMNLQNTHFSYVLSPAAEQPYQPSELGFRAVYYNWPEDQARNVRNRYLNSVHDVDSLLAGFVRFLKDKGLWDECLFVVVGDNGEAFYEHGFGNHSGPMYDEVVRTLAFIKLPASSTLPRERIYRPVSHIDIAATIPDVLGMPRPWSFQGRSVFSAGCLDRPVYMYSNAIVRQYGIVSWPWKYLVTLSPRPNEELFDLRNDPLEKSNLAGSGVDEAARLKESLFEWVTVQQTYYSDAVYRQKAAPDLCQGLPGKDPQASRIHHET
jgi:arylsulfatase A-like enzyme